MENTKHNETEKLNQPITLEDFLGWEENTTYRYGDNKYKIYEGLLLIYNRNANCWYEAYERVNDYLRIRQAKKVEKTIKGYHVKDRYSYDCLMKELEEQGYRWFSNKKPTDRSVWGSHKHNTIIYCNKNKELAYSTLEQFSDHDKIYCELIEYHKAEPKFYAKVKGTQVDIRNVDGLGLELTMTEWSELGINDTKVDFRKSGIIKEKD